jgi:multiple sugar transport system substrate-binding protein
MIGGLLTCFAIVTMLAAQSGAAPQTEVAYNTFLDPNNKTDPRSAAQNAMIAEFERQHPAIHVRVVVDPSGANGLRTVSTHAPSPDVVRVTSFQLPEFVATGGLMSLDTYIARDKVSRTDWLLPLSLNQIRGNTYSIQQDYRIPILMYRKHLLEAIHAAPPRAWPEVCETGGKLTRQSVIGYAIPIGVTGGIGGAQAFGEFLLSSLLSAPDGKYFAEDNRTIAFSRDSFVRAARLIKNLFVQCKASTAVTLQFGFNEVHDGLRAGTIAMATFGLYRFRTIQQQGAGDDLAWSDPPGYSADQKQTVYGFGLTINQFSNVKDAAWEFVRFMTSTEAEAMAARGGEVVARASAYKDPYFASPGARDQLGWAALIRRRGMVVHYSILQSTFHQIVADAFQRMILENRSPEDTYSEVVTKYDEALKTLK